MPELVIELLGGFAARRNDKSIPVLNQTKGGLAGVSGGGRREDASTGDACGIAMSGNTRPTGTGQSESSGLQLAADAGMG